MRSVRVLLLAITLLSVHFAFAQKPAKGKGPEVIVKNEFCAPEAYADDGVVADSAPKIVDETLVEKIVKSLNYQAVYKKVNSDYTVTKWKIKNTYDEKQIDTIAIVSGGRQSDRFVYYIINKSAGASLPGLMNAKINRDVVDVIGIKVGMSRKEVERLIGKRAIGSTLIITNEPQNIYLSIFFTNDAVSNMSFSSYSE